MKYLDEFLEMDDIDNSIDSVSFLDECYNGWKRSLFFTRVNIVIRHIIFNNPICVFIYNIGYYNNYSIYMKMIDYLEEKSKLLEGLNLFYEEVKACYSDGVITNVELYKLGYFADEVFNKSSNYFTSLINAKRKEIKYKGMHMSVTLDDDSSYDMDEFCIFYKEYLNKKKDEFKR